MIDFAYRRGVAAMLAGVAAFILVGCSSSGTAKSPSSSHASPSSSTSSATGVPTADAAAVAAIGKAYGAFFDSKSATSESQAALQDGAVFAATLAEQAKSSYSKTSTALVDTVRVKSPNLAYLTYTLTSGGQVLLKNAPGYAVRENGTWKVAAQTFCGLLTLQGDAPSACNDPKVTALPN